VPIQRSVVVRTIVLSALAVFVAAVGPASAQTVRIFQQPPCNLLKGVCISLNPARLKTATLRAYTFNAPGPGVASVSFTGTMTCVNNQVGTFGNLGVFDFETQITTESTLIPDYNAPSGARWTAQLPPATTAVAYSQAVNIASTRRIVFQTGGSKTVYFRYTVNRLDQGTSCSVWSAGFDVVYAAR
jgi:hypothetical protein